MIFDLPYAPGVSGILHGCLFCEQVVNPARQADGAIFSGTPDGRQLHFLEFKTQGRSVL